jgi:hypothetical protein
MAASVHDLTIYHLPLYSKRQICAAKDAMEGRGINYQSISLQVLHVCICG